MENLLYGDGIHDDTAAIQELIESGCEVNLPVPKKHYLISRPLELHSNLKLTLPRFAEIRLKDCSNCYMLKNAMLEDRKNRIDVKLFDYVNRYCPDMPCENIEVCGGIWNFNNKNQNPNPLSCGRYEPEGYTGLCFLFYNVKNLRLSSLTLKDPVNFAVTLDKVSYFKVDNITFDFNDGNLYQSNMDGIHLCGNCNHGSIENLFGTCYDDTVAMNAEEGSRGVISDVTVRGIYTENAYSAVRLLSASPECAVRNIHISDVHGTFYHFGICFMPFYTTGKRGLFENITINNMYGGKSSRDLVKFYKVHQYRKYALVDVEGGVDVKNLAIRDLHRREFVDGEVPTLQFAKGAVIENLTLENITAENFTDKENMPFIVNKAEINGSNAEELLK